jgi:trehalose/maltose transport system permease protein
MAPSLRPFVSLANELTFATTFRSGFSPTPPPARHVGLSHDLAHSTEARVSILHHWPYQRPKLGVPMRRLGFYAAVVLIVAGALLPVYALILASFASDQGQFQVAWLPDLTHLDNYRSILGQRGFGLAIVNSTLVAGTVVALSLGLAVMAAYGLRVRFRGRSLLLMTILATSMFPQIAILAGMFELTRALGLYNHLGAMITAQMAMNLPFAVWLLTIFMRDLPVEIEEAAVIDGATPLVLVRKIFLPLLAPAMVTTGLLTFIASWNEFLFALTLTISEDMRTVPVVMTMISPMAWQETAAASILVTLPMVALVLVFQRRLVSGLTAGALAG